MGWSMSICPLLLDGAGTGLNPGTQQLWSLLFLNWSWLSSGRFPKDVHTSSAPYPRV